MKEPVDYIVASLVFIIGFVVCGAMIESVFFKLPSNIDGPKLITGLLTSMIAIVSIYVGAKLKNRNGKD